MSGPWDGDTPPTHGKFPAVPPRVHKCVHELIAQQAQAYPDAPAVFAHDGAINYRELDTLSDQLAIRLAKQIPAASIIPLCFEKSLYTSIAVLAVLKTGSAFVLLDVSQPEARLRGIVQQTGAPVICSSASSRGLSERLIGSSYNVVVTDPSSIANGPEVEGVGKPFPAKVSPSSACYCVFTSGSTGQPKGVVLSHSNICSAFEHQLAHLGFTQHQRVFDFASASFDVAVHNVLATLASGGCLCVPSEHERVQDPTGAMADMKVTLANFTPSVAQLIDPARVPSLETVIFLGESLSRREAQRWTGKHIMNTYGPAEATPIATINSELRSWDERSDPSVGLPVGVVAWVVDPQNHDVLLEHGEIGELLLEGPLVSDIGYINDPKKVAQVFISSPTWLSRLRQSKLYATGDLVRTDQQGHLRFVGRKDFQVKIHGQRVELGEIEHHVQSCFPKASRTVAELIVSGPSTSIVAFLEMPLQTEHPKNGAMNGDTAKVQWFIPEAETIQVIATRIPAYMIPASYFTIYALPSTATGKTDRKRLRELVSPLLAHRFTNKPRRLPVSDMERHVQSLWAEVLELDPLRIGLDDEFINLGGDSVAAIRLSAAAAKIGLQLLVAEIFNHRSLEDQACIAIPAATCTVIAPFQLLGGSHDIEAMARSCGVDASALEDAYPLTPLQQGLFSLTQRHPSNYVLQTACDISRLDAKAVVVAWEQLCRAHPILRTRMVESNSSLIQVVVRQDHLWSRRPDLEEYLSSDRTQPMVFGQPLSRFALVGPDPQVPTHIVLTIHHAIYDAWSLDLLMADVRKLYRGESLLSQSSKMVPTFNTFVEYTERSRNQDATQEYWRNALQDSQSTPFPAKSLTPHTAHSRLQYWCKLAPMGNRTSEATSSVIVRAALAIILSRYTQSSDVVFGVTVSGRNAPVHFIDSIAGPTIATLPVRIRLGDTGVDVAQYLSAVQRQATEMIPFEQIGLQHIARLGDGPRTACNFNTLLVVQPYETKARADVFDSWEIKSEELDTYGLTLECSLTPEAVNIDARFNLDAISAWRLQRMLQQLEHVLQQLSDVSFANTPLSRIEVLSERDRTLLSRVNAEIPQAVDKTVVDLFQDQARKQSADHQGIHSWDGSLTYRELDLYSQNIAGHLQRCGIGSGALVPICFEKTLFVVIAMIAVLKTGAAFVPIEPSVPAHRRQDLLDEIGASLVITSSSHTNLFDSNNYQIIVLDHNLAREISNNKPTIAQPMSADSTAYVLFTSGSTGKPKGVVLDHRAVASSCTRHGMMLGFNAASRVLQFSAYTFDACIAECLTTLVSGGCICIPSDEDRLYNLTDSINRMAVNWMFLTPPVAKLLDPSAVQCVQTIAIGGEKFSDADAKRWTQDNRRVVLVYGPTECAVYCTGHEFSEQADSSIIGKPIGCVAWVVDVNDHQKLAPVGAPGELCTEGPILARGYLNDSHKTATSFVEVPDWLEDERLIPTAERKRRIYKTGDVVEYTPTADGSLTLRYLGRKDTQVKLRGQRLELSEVENHVSSCFPTARQVVAELIQPPHHASGGLLVVFVSVDGTVDDQASDPIAHMTVQPEIRHAILERLPGYMVPSQFFSVQGEMPRMTSSSKTDRKQLREIGVALYIEQQAREGRSGSDKRQPTNDAEVKLRAIWAKVLGIDEASVGTDDSFFRLGGDSISTISLVSEARKHGFALTASTVFSAPTLEQQAHLRAQTNGSGERSVAPFSITNPGVDVQALREDVALLCSGNLKPASVEDVYPATPLQEGLMSLGSKRSGDYILQSVLTLPPDLRIAAFKAAWEQTVTRVLTLRTRIVQHSELGLLQVVLQSATEWEEQDQTLEEYLQADKFNSMSLGQALSRFAILTDADRPRYFVWTAHHAVYDGWVLPLIARTAEAFYMNRPPATDLLPFNTFIDYVEQQKGSIADRYWRDTLKQHDSSPFPALPSHVREPVADCTIHRRSSSLQRRSTQDTTDTTVSTIMQAALALVIGRYTGSRDAIFGTTVSGRNAPIAGISAIAGPTIATLPLRISIPSASNTLVQDLLRLVQRQASERVPYEQIGLQNIARLSKDAQSACKFQTLLVIQTGEDELPKQQAFGTWTSKEQLGFTSYAVTIECIPLEHEMSLRARFDSAVIEPWNMERLLNQITHVAEQLSNAVNDVQMLLIDVEVLSREDHVVIQEWNAKPPATAVERCIHHMIEEQVQVRPQAMAVDGHDGNFTYAELENLSTRLAQQLVDLGVAPEVFVPLCFSKSSWTVVAMLGVLKAGGAFVLLDPTHPADRLRMLCKKTRANIAVASPSTVDRLDAFVKRVVVIGPTMTERLPYAPSAAPVASSSPSATAYTIFTSGSTGVPKGCKIEHRSYCSAAVNHGSVMTMSPSTRSLQGGSYSFAGAIMEILMTLIHGGCVCVPSDEERTTKLDQAIVRLNANWAFLTSSVLSSLNPDMVQCLKTICVGGEAIHAAQISQWCSRVHLRQTYGSAETSAVVSSAHLTENDSTSDVGRPTAGKYWVVDPTDVDKLAPLGAIGECVIEGPTIGREYLDEPEKTAAAFIKAPAWRSSFGELENGSRFYKTGDLCTYTSDGAVRLLGRKDTQIKLRGQRVELGEIEHQARSATEEVAEIAVELAIPRDADVKAAMLVAFVVLRKSVSALPEPQHSNASTILSKIRERLQHGLPQYMVPSVFLALPEMPKTISKKTDRKRLREMAAEHTRQQLVELGSLANETKRQPTTNREQQMQAVWARLLDVQAGDIGIDDDFFHIGGDSVSALQLVAEARKLDVELSMADVFRLRTLSAQAQAAHVPAIRARIAPFSLLNCDMNEIERLRQELAAAIKVRSSQVEDVYPSTPLQEGLISLTSRTSGEYMLQNVLEIGDSIDIDAFKLAWHQAVAAIAVLRTRLSHHKDLGILQVVVKEKIVWHQSSAGLKDFLARDRLHSMELDQPLSRFTLVGSNAAHPSWLVWTVHHALYDGWSLPMMIDIVREAYLGKLPQQQLKFAPFIQYASDLNEDDVRTFWTSELGDYDGSAFPPLPTPVYVPNADAEAERVYEIPGLLKSAATLTTLIRAALAILISKHTASSDIMFGAVLSGRNAPVEGINQIIGPTLAVVPVRVQLSHNLRVLDYLRILQGQSDDMIPYEQTGLQNIKTANERATDFQSLLVIQPAEQSSVRDDVFGAWITDEQQHGFTTYALTLQVTLPTTGTDTRVKASFDSKALSPWLMSNMLDQLGAILGQLASARPDQMVEAIDLVTERARNKLWDLNSNVPAAVSECVHDIIHRRAKMQPDAIAVTSWDGEMSYATLESLSTRLAKHILSLASMHIGKILPMCFEKSAYATVAMLAAMKAGFGSVTLDTTLPPGRLQTVVAQIEPPFILCSVLNQRLANDLLPRKPVIVVGPAELSRMTSESEIRLPVVSPDQTICILFTSGSTGVPKGAAITHSNFATAIKCQAKRFGHRPGARIYGFASYGFDISWFDTLHALASGSTLCVPSESERRDDLDGSIARFEATSVFLTPSVARLIHPHTVPSLELLALGGEPQRWSDFSGWPEHIQKVSVYGPCECTVVSSAEDARILEKRDMTLPAGIGLNTWLADPANPRLLAPIGAVGEIWLEGPLVGTGYLGDVKRTAAAFVDDPEWLLRGGEHAHPGRRGRTYRTGDLARLNADGSMSFAGRKDNQVKIRGQRVELAEVEHHVLQSMGHIVRQVVAEIVAFTDARDTATLVAFVEKTDQIDNNSGDPLTPLENTRVMKLLPEVHKALSSSLPSYMMPQIYFEVPSIPRTVNGKTDRKLLRATASQFSTRDLVRELRSEHTNAQPSTTSEMVMQKLWAEVLAVPTPSIEVDDNFFQSGGDSISAMKMVGKARKKGFVSSVADLFAHPTMREQSQLQTKERQNDSTNGDLAEVAAFQNFDQTDVQAIGQELATTYDITSEIEDLYPATPLQEGLLSLTMKTSGDYMMQSVLELNNTENFRIDVFKQAWETTVQSIGILRTRMVQHENYGLLQLLLRHESIRWDYIFDHSLHEYLLRDKQTPMGFGHPLSRFALFGAKNDKKPRWFVWTIHHALYDGYSLPIITRTTAQIYTRLLEPPSIAKIPSTDFKSFAQYVYSRQNEASARYWTSALDGTQAGTFPTPQASASQRRVYETVDHDCFLPQETIQRLPFTVSTLIRGALALLLSRRTSVPEAVFGAIVSGRNAPVEGIEDIVGPTIATVPIRTHVLSKDTVSSYLSNVQQQATDMIPHEQTGLQNIIRCSQDARMACDFQTLLVVQPQALSKDDDTAVEPYGKWMQYSEQQGFTTYALTIECTPSEQGMSFRAIADSSVLDSWTVHHLLSSLGSILRQLIEASPHIELAEVSSLSSEARELIWQWNAAVPSKMDRCVHDMIKDRIHEQPEALAVCAHDAQLTYAELDKVSDVVATALIEAGVRPGEDIVPICVEKSAFAAVSVLGVLKAGAAFVFLDAETQPESRLRSIVGQTRAKVICSSVSHKQLSRCFIDKVIVVGPSTRQSGHAISFPDVRPSMPVYVCFTSGSTGRPKGAILSHSNVASALHHQLGPMGFNRSTRCYDFASFSFDVAIHNMLATLTAGGCLLVPSDSDRKSRLAASMEEFSTNYVSLTASVARLLDPMDMPSLKTIMLGGEPVTQDVVDKWWGKVELINSCGPAECTSVSVLNATADTSSAIRAIGYGVGTMTWIVDPEDHNTLLPPGETGELLLEGPNVGCGYLNDPERTAASFIDDPTWLVAGSASRPGRRGKVYKTGDLVHYKEDGSLDIVGRKDNQTKVRGQRLELEEVEYHLRQCLPGTNVVADTMKLNESTSSTLLAFVCFHIESSTETAVAIDFDAIERMAAIIPRLNQKLSQRLPPYMVPSVYVSVSRIPMTATEKTDRRSLRVLATSLPREQLDQLLGQHLSAERQAPRTETETKIRTVWAKVLETPENDIGVFDSFFELGGDSISAMKAVGQAHKLGFHFSVSDLFEKQSIAGLVELLRKNDDHATTISIPSPSPFSLVDKATRDSIIASLAPSIEAANIEDMLPMTDFQTQIVHHSMAVPSAYCNYFWLEMERSIDIERLHRSCQALVDHYPLLRSAFALYQETFYMGILRQSTAPFSTVKTTKSLDIATEAYCLEDSHHGLPNGDIPTSFVLVVDAQENRRLVVRLSHIQYDGISVPIMLQSLSDLYHGRTVSDTLSFSSYLAYQIEQRPRSVKYWQERLAGCTNAQLTFREDDHAKPRKILVGRSIALPPLPTGASPAALLGAAWAAILSMLTKQNDIVFGHLVAGRESELPGIQEIVGPCVAIVPIRTNFIAGQTSPMDLMQTVQEQLRALHGTMLGWDDIVRSSTDWQDFTMSSIVQHQNIDEHPTVQLGDTSARLQWYENPDAPPPTLGLASYPDGRNLKIEVRASSQILSVKKAEVLLDCLQDAVELMATCSQEAVSHAKVEEWERVLSTLV